MAVGYRSVIRVSDRENAVRIANEQFRSWLVEQSKDPKKGTESADWDGPGTYQLGPGCVLSVVQQDGEAGLTRLLLEYVDTNEYGVWTTRCYAVSAPASKRHQQILWFESEGEGRRGQPVYPGTPRVVRRTLAAVEAYDSTVPVLSTPRVIRPEDVAELLGFVEDEHRDIAVVVVAPVPGVPASSWADAINTLSRDAVGCASFFVLSEDAAEQFNSGVGRTHAVPQGALRTYMPGVVLDDWADARRHRIMTARTLAAGLSDKLKFAPRLVKAVATSPRATLLGAQLPSELTRAVRVLQREQLKLTVHETALPADDEAGGSQTAPSPSATAPRPTTVTERPEAPPEQATTRAEPAPWLGRLKALALRLVGHDRIDEDALRDIAQRFDQQEAATFAALRNAERLQAERERLEDELVSLRRQLEAEQLERAVAEVERRSAEKKARSLERWLAEREDRYSYVEAGPDVLDDEPANVSEIVERLTDPERYADVLRYVELTDPNKAIDHADVVDAVDPNGTYASAFWEYVLVLRDYVAECVERGFSGNLHMYLNSPEVVGRKCPVQRHKPNESDTVQTNSRMRRERTFPIPRAVDPTGQIFMTAHFAPTHRDQNAPRMYYYADVANTGKAYIGYIGTHLTNTKTN